MATTTGGRGRAVLAAARGSGHPHGSGMASPGEGACERGERAGEGAGEEWQVEGVVNGMGVTARVRPAVTSISER